MHVRSLRREFEIETETCLVPASIVPRRHKSPSNFTLYVHMLYHAHARKSAILELNLDCLLSPLAELKFRKRADTRHAMQALCPFGVTSRRLPQATKWLADLRRHVAL